MTFTNATYFVTMCANAQISEINYVTTFQRIGTYQRDHFCIENGQVATAEVKVCAVFLAVT